MIMKSSKTGFWLIFRNIIPAVLITAGFFSCKSSSSTTSDLISFEAMNTFMSIKSFGNKASAANKAAKLKIIETEKLISVTDSQSEVYKINNSNNTEILLSDELAELFSSSLNAAFKTQGAFNPFLYPITKEWGFTTKNYHVPENSRIKELQPLTDYKKARLEGKTLIKEPQMQLDFGGIGKGFAGDLAIEVLKEKGIKSAVLDLGGNIQLLGSKADGSDWNIGLRNPWEEAAKPVFALKLNDCAVITSGGYERYFTGDDGKEYIHIFDSSTGRPVDNELVSVTIITKKGITGDLLSTALFAMGKEKAIDFWKNCQDYDFEIILLCKDYSAVISEGIEKRITSLADFSKVEVCKKQ